mmetsp:Transcript_52934/g.115775  ORF Transcript_52934/g.115775 Transcript_52934/m.115775 type:complete len:1228 (+) Transcript_52934:1277-4960(+)
MKTNTEMKKLGAKKDGVLFLTYHMLVSARQKSAEAQNDPQKSRFGQVLAWLTKHEDGGEGLICFDEAHKAKNLDQNSKVARLVDELQRCCPGCGVLYASATGATEVGHMQYMSRLGLWGSGELTFDDAEDEDENNKAGTNNKDEESMGEEKLNDAAISGAAGGGERPPFENFQKFRNLVQKGGMAAMELVAVQLKSMGALSCRSLAFEGTTFDLLTVELAPHARSMYDASCELWRDMGFILETGIGEGLCKASQRAEFWGAQQRFFKGLVVAAKVDETVKLVKQALGRGEAAVISLWTTNEAVTAKAAKEAGDDDRFTDNFASGPELTVEQFLDRHIPVVDAKGHSVSWAASAVKGLKERLFALKLPPNPIDDIIDKLGGPTKVAEMSGRSLRYTRDATTGEVRAEPRKGSSGAPGGKGGGKGRLKTSASSSSLGGADSMDSVNNSENRAFQSGKKLVAIITEAASAGISLHADRREEANGNKPRPRRMICLELPWAADKAVQQLGRVHRSNQVHPPAFTCVVSDLGGEARFISAVTRRLRQLGAMTRGDRHISLGSADAFGFGALDIMSGPYGPKALGNVFTDLLLRDATAGNPPSGRWPGGGDWAEFASVALKELESQEVGVDPRMATKPDSLKRFLNRMLGMTCDTQVGLFFALSSHIAKLEEADREAGTVDNGVVSLNKQGRWGKLRSIEELEVENLCSKPGKTLDFRRLKLDRGLTWEAAVDMIRAAKPDEQNLQGFYLRPRDNAQSEALLVLRRRLRERADGAGDPQYVLHFPHLPSSSTLDSHTCTARSILNSRFVRCDDDRKTQEARRLWITQHRESENKCIHVQRQRRCNVPNCAAGRRCFQETMLTGQILAQWDLIQQALGGIHRTTLVRTALEDGRVLVGLLLPESSEESLKTLFAQREASERERLEALRQNKSLYGGPDEELAQEEEEWEYADEQEQYDDGFDGFGYDDHFGSNYDDAGGGGSDVYAARSNMIPSWAGGSSSSTEAPQHLAPARPEPAAKRPRTAASTDTLVVSSDEEDVVAVNPQRRVIQPHVPNRGMQRFAQPQYQQQAPNLAANFPRTPAPPPPPPPPPRKEVPWPQPRLVRNDQQSSPVEPVRQEEDPPLYRKSLSDDSALSAGSAPSSSAPKNPERAARLAELKARSQQKRLRSQNAVPANPTNPAEQEKHREAEPSGRPTSVFDSFQAPPKYLKERWYQPDKLRQPPPPEKDFYLMSHV